MPSESVAPPSGRSAVNCFIQLRPLHLGGAITYRSVNAVHAIAMSIACSDSPALTESDMPFFIETSFTGICSSEAVESCCFSLGNRSLPCRLPLNARSMCRRMPGHLIDKSDERSKSMELLRAVSMHSVLAGKVQSTCP